MREIIVLMINMESPVLLIRSNLPMIRVAAVR